MASTLLDMGKFGGDGLGKQIMQQIIKEALQEGITAVQWQTSTFNTRAISFYHCLGAKSKEKQRFFLEVAQST